MFESTTRRTSFLMAALLLSLESVKATTIALQPSLGVRLLPEKKAVLQIRGGASTTNTTTEKSSKSAKKRKTKKKKKKEGAKSAINTAMKEKDAAEALGDAIRDNADILRSEDPLLHSIDMSVTSLGYALGASDGRQQKEDGGGVEASPSSVLANYFLNSHGGAHAFQSACSFLATSCAFAMIATSQKTKSDAKLTLLRRTLLFAMLKHISGLFASAAVAAKAVPKVGLGEARKLVEQTALDPVSQYVFYTGILYTWLPAAKQIENCWWFNSTKIPFALFLIAPILLREVISMLLIVSDVLVLLSVGDADRALTSILKVSQSVVNAGMSVLVSPEAWRSADPSQRQAILAKLVGRASLVFELVVGVILAQDALMGLFGFITPMGGGKRTTPKEFAKRLICARLFLHFLWLRRTKIETVISKLRGGASKLPMKILDAIYEPGKAMGISRPNNKARNAEEMTWKDYAVVGLGMDQ